MTPYGWGQVSFTDPLARTVRAPRIPLNSSSTEANTATILRYARDGIEIHSLRQKVAILAQLRQSAVEVCDLYRHRPFFLRAKHGWIDFERLRRESSCGNAQHTASVNETTTERLQLCRAPREKASILLHSAVLSTC